MRQLEQEYSGHAEGESDLKRMFQVETLGARLVFPVTLLTRFHSSLVSLHGLEKVAALRL